MSEISSRYDTMVEMSDPAAINLARFNRYMREIVFSTMRIGAYKCTGADADKCKAVAASVPAMVAKARKAMTDAQQQAPGYATELNVTHGRFEAIIPALDPLIVQGLADDDTAVPGVEKVAAQTDTMVTDNVALVDRIIAANRQTASELRANAERGQWMMVGRGPCRRPAGGGRQRLDLRHED